ncbi:MAG: hypothetical protein KJN76_02655 [Eudoraea sp.]|nr:hypothetical protein [Eudoraea sp.]
MKINTTTAAVEYRGGQKVIYVYDYGSQENQDDPEPVFFIEKKANRKGQQKMYPIMQ